MISSLFVLFVLCSSQDTRVPDIIQGVDNYVTGDGGNVIIGDGNTVHAVDVTFSEDFNKMISSGGDITAMAEKMIASRLTTPTNTVTNVEVNKTLNSPISNTSQNNTTSSTGIVKIQSITVEPISTNTTTNSTKNTTATTQTITTVPISTTTSSTIKTDSLTKTDNRIIVASATPTQSISYLPHLTSLLFLYLLL